MTDSVTLYIATHNITGIKYFGKTSSFFTEEELQRHYNGSGLYWKRHITKYGDDVTMSIYGIFGTNEVKDVALAFSNEHNIVESSMWANLKDENGLDGSPKGVKFSETHKKNIGIASKRKFENIADTNARNSLDALNYSTYKTDSELDIINKKKANHGSKNGMYGTSRTGIDCPTYGKVWVTKEGVNKMVSKIELNKFISLGWAKGVKQKNITMYTLWCRNVKISHNTISW